ncbi:hypothetical protein GCM10022415_23660 [Knoellia locipacati]|uniref:HTH merR-type domain-containing protein n=1 Tax=Knoellia locipacati TaxID=882824 RepID=A0A512T265_9MICO|nr:MerR family transcriptional regulator [Knoellia locipacati]GEQ14315.1 hypothetical protein KLO01_23620 [Knoellia locipacati]
MQTAQHEYTIREAAALTGLSASTLRYYEGIGVIPPITRGESSGHRVYLESDLDQLTSVACLAATGMSIGDMKQYVANGPLGASAAEEQVALLTEQQQRLTVEAEQLELRQRYVALKIRYWHAVEQGDDVLAQRLAGEARALADGLRRSTSH